MNRFLILAVLAAAAAAPARADIPPPPYHGSSSGTFAGLVFDRVDSKPPPEVPHPGPPRRPYKVVRLKACAGASANCAAVTRAGVIGWGVSKVDGQWVSYGDIDALGALFRGHRGRVKITFIRIDGAADGQKDVTLDAR